MDSGFQEEKGGTRDAKLLLMPKVLLSALVVVAVLIAGCIFVPFPMSVRRQIFPLVAGLALLFAVLGVALIVVGARMRAERMLKVFLILTGSCAAGVLLCAVLHNVVYGLLIHCFGADVWDRLGLSDESFFFILALFVCPALFGVGTIGSFVLLFKRRTHRPVAEQS